MKKINPVFFLLILWFGFSLAPNAAEEEKALLTSISKRSKIFEQYYGGENYSPRVSVFEHMKGWHFEDFQAIYRSVHNAGNQQNLESLYNLLDGSFRNNTVTFSTIAGTYLAYSMILSADRKNRKCEGNKSDTIDVIKYFVKNIQLPPDFVKNSALSELSEPFYRIIVLRDYNLRWLPYVSEYGTASFRILNNQFGMRAPLIGIPLKLTSYDGYINSSAYSFVNHEINHGGFFDSGNFRKTLVAYDYYNIANSVIKKIQDKKIQSLCDFYLFHLGHERFFSINLYGKVAQDGTTWIPGPIFFTDINIACDDILKELEAGILKLSQPIEPDPLHNFIKEICREQDLSNDYYQGKPKLDYFMNPQNGKLYSPIELVNRYNLKRDKPLDNNERNQEINFESEDTWCLKPSDYGFNFWYYNDFNVRCYKQLIEWRNFFNKICYPFTLWKGVEFQADKIISSFREMCEIFKREVGPTFKELGY